MGNGSHVKAIEFTNWSVTGMLGVIELTRLVQPCLLLSSEGKRALFYFPCKLPVFAYLVWLLQEMESSTLGIRAA